MVESFGHFPVPVHADMLRHNLVEVPGRGNVHLAGYGPQHFEGEALTGCSSHDELSLGVPCLEGGDEGLAMQGVGLFFIEPPDAVC